MKIPILNFLCFILFINFTFADDKTSTIIVTDGSSTATAVIGDTNPEKEEQTAEETLQQEPQTQKQLNVKIPEIPMNAVTIPEETIISTKYGNVEGFIHLIGTTSYGPVTANIFLGIPYAQPPIGKNRFEKPQPPINFLNGQINATKFPPGCASFAPLVGEPRFSEDCLYLNVYAPPKRFITSPNGFPVLVWIHGGGFAAGNTQLYGYKEFAANFVSRGIVVVSIQYRLGMFGFMSTGNKMMPGNLGLWDQRQALLWIQENIRQFGGDPKRVTLWGQNSGSAMIGALSLSKQTRDLFSQTIEMSGSVFSGWALSNSVVETSHKIAKTLDCPVNISKKMRDCLKKKTVEEIALAGAKLGWRRDEVNYVRMQMRYDDDFFDKELDQLLAEAPPKPTIQGINSQESLVLTMPFPGSPKDSSLIIKPEELDTFNRDHIVKFIRTIIVPEGMYGNQTVEVQNAIINFYADRNASQDVDAKFYLTRYTQILSDLQFNMPTLLEVSKKSQENWPVYLYLINYMNSELSFPAFGVCQTYEFPYLFGFSVVQPFKFNEDDYKFQQVMIQSFAHFIAIGNPSTSLGIWPAVTAEHPFAFFDMKPEPVLRDNLMLDRLMFWEELTTKYHIDSKWNKRKLKIDL